MSEIKPVYQLRYGTGDVEVTEEQYFRESYMRGTPRRMLYPAAAYEALRKEKAELKQKIVDIETAHKFTNQMANGVFQGFDRALTESENMVEALRKENEALIQKLETAAFNHFAAQERIEAQAKRIVLLEYDVKHLKDALRAYGDEDIDDDED